MLSYNFKRFLDISKVMRTKAEQHDKIMAPDEVPVCKHLKQLAENMHPKTQQCTILNLQTVAQSL